MASRSRTLPAALFVATLLALPCLAVASDVGGGEGNPWMSLGLKFLNFGILVGGLFYLLRKPVRQALVDRHEAVRKALEDARKAKEEAEVMAAEYAQRVANLAQEVDAIRAQVRSEAERQKEQILADAEAAAEGVRRQAAAAGANEVKRAQDILRTDAVELAVQLAQDLLAKNYTAEDQNKAVQLTIQNIEGLH